MALVILGFSQCALCEQVLQVGDDLVATSHFLDEADPLWRYSDAAFHRACFLAWDAREAFIEKYNRAAAGHSHMDERGNVWSVDEGSYVHYLCGSAVQ